MVGLAHTQVVEEDLVELVVVVLAGMHEHMVAVLVQRASTRDSRMISGRVPTTVMTLSFFMSDSPFTANRVGPFAVEDLVGPQHHDQFSLPTLVTLCVQPGAVSTMRASPPDDQLVRLIASRCAETEVRPPLMTRNFSVLVWW
jgi:hypothetical protein